jgi:hypothetical protein
VYSVLSELKAQRCDRVWHVTLRALGCPEGRNRQEWQALGAGRSFFTTGIAASPEPLRHISPYAAMLKVA